MNNELKVQEKYWDETVKEFDSIYTQDKSAFANFLDKAFRWDMYERFNFAMHQCVPSEGRSVLDVGCGTGRYLLGLGKRNMKKFVGLDVAQNMLSIAEDLCKKEGIIDRCEFHHTDLLHYQTNETYDYSIAIGLFDYVKDPQPILNKLNKVTSIRSVMTFPRSNTWRAPVRKVRLSIKKCPVYFFSREEIEKMLNEAGFKDNLIFTRGALYFVSANL